MSWKRKDRVMQSRRFEHEATARALVDRIKRGVFYDGSEVEEDWPELEYIRLECRPVGPWQVIGAIDVGAKNE